MPGKSDFCMNIFDMNLSLEIKWFKGLKEEFQNVAPHKITK